MCGSSIVGWLVVWLMNRPGYVQHAWEDDVGHPWERDTSNMHENEDDDLLSPAEQAEEFLDMLVALKMRNKLSAKDICILAYRASRAGKALSEGVVWEVGKNARHRSLFTAPGYCVIA